MTILWGVGRKPPHKLALMDRPEAALCHGPVSTLRRINEPEATCSSRSVDLKSQRFAGAPTSAANVLPMAVKEEDANRLNQPFRVGNQ